MKLDLIIRENINRYVNNIIKENEELTYGNETSEKFKEFSDNISNIEDVRIGHNVLYLETENYMFKIVCEIYDDRVSYVYDQPSGESVHDEYGDVTVDDFDITCEDIDDEDIKYDLSPDEISMMEKLFKENVVLDSSDVYTSDDAEWDRMSDALDMEREGF